jgi:Domain of unknown function (DUF4160)
MPTVLRVDGWRIVIYPNDHPPAHVHVLGPGWVVMVNLLGPEVREAIDCGEHEARQVLRRVTEHQEALMSAWRRFHE